MEVFATKRKRIVLYDQLEYKNRIVNLRLKGLDNTLSPILSDINFQLQSIAQTLSMSFDDLFQQENSEVVINLGGMLFQTQEPLTTGKVIELQLKLAPDIHRLLIIAEVLRCEQISRNRFTTAIAFTYIEPDDKVLLQSFVDQRLNEYNIDLYSDRRYNQN